MNTRKSGKLKLFFFLISFLGGSAVLIFNDYGVIKYSKLQNELESLNESIEQTDNENKVLEGEIDSLEKKIPAKIEQTAREKYNMNREGEKVIKMIEK
jgi:cell division protein FtsL